MNTPIIFTNTQTTLLNTLLSRYNANLFVPTNTASGTNSATLHKMSGAVTFTSSIPNGGVAYFTLNNSFITETSKINPDLIYDNQEGGNGNPQICNCSLSTGQAIFAVSNTIDGADATPITIQFKIELT